MLRLGADHCILGGEGGGGTMFCFPKKVVQQIAQKKFVLTTHEKNKKFRSKPMECFMPEGGGGGILFGSTREKNLLFGLGNET